MDVGNRPRFLLLLALLPIFLGGLYLSSRLTLADHFYRAHPPTRALALAPWNTSYRLRDASPDDLRSIVEHNPAASFRSGPWIALALSEEAAGDAAAAEKHFLHAVTLDATFAPRWALINFYLRQERKADFWKWSADGVRLFEGDLTGVYRLAIAEGGAGQAWIRLQPKRPAALRQFLNLTLTLSDLPPSGAAAALAGHGRDSDRAQLLSYCERALKVGQVDAAVLVWNAMASRGLHPLGRLDPIRGPILSNGAFRHRPSGAGFDWRLPAASAGSIHLSARGLAIELSGRQEDRVVLLRQILPVCSAVRYRLSAKVIPGNGAVLEGLYWRIGPQASPRLSKSQAPWEFVPLPPGQATVLELVAERESGRPRPEGSLAIEQVDIRPLQ
ncbi:MAG: hypothetical protein R2762_18140 [Bryobacteraceae bacterium]